MLIDMELPFLRQRSQFTEEMAVIKILPMLFITLFVPLTSSAGIVGSKHDLSSTNYYGDDGRGDTEVCVFCHTPHFSSSTIEGPIWNRNITDTTIFTLYSGVNAQPNNPTMLCLSCHDGVANRGYQSAVSSWDAMHTINEPGPGLANTAGLGTGNCNACHAFGRTVGGGLPNDGYPGKWWMIGPDLSNDHPVSINYAASLAAFPGEFRPVSSVLADGFRLPDGNVECVTCHDAHDPSNGLFLRKSNINSNVCKTCHIK